MSERWGQRSSMQEQEDGLPSDLVKQGISKAHCPLANDVHMLPLLLWRSRDKSIVRDL